jgi:prepilin-type N-terminal cleavage/methylation domain-containing protein
MAAKAMTTISPTGNAQPAADVDHRRRVPNRSRAFTLVELILVMALLGVVLGAGAPALGRFFQGRTLSSEARRFLGLTHYAQSRAVSEGIPMVVWIDPIERAYGLRAETSYTELDARAVEFTLADGIVIELEEVTPVANTLLSPTPWQQTARIARNQPALRFTPDGSIAPTSPRHIVIREDNLGEIWIGQSRTRLHYEIQTNNPSYAPR